MSLSSLNSSLSHWNNQVRTINASIKKLRRRRSDVDEVIGNLKNTARNNASDVNKKINTSIGKLDSAIDYQGKNNLLRAILSGKNEGLVGTDNDLTSADGELKRELNSIDRQIADSEGDLLTAKSRVSNIKADIAAEERRQREEAAQKAAEERRQREEAARRTSEAKNKGGKVVK